MFLKFSSMARIANSVYNNICPGDISKIIANKQDFKQLEDFNK